MVLSDGSKTDADTWGKRWIIPDVFILKWSQRNTSKYVIYRERDFLKEW